MAYKPGGYTSVAPYLTVNGAQKTVDFLVRVFSAQTGALVFQTDDLARKWDGRLPNGNFAEEGNYQCVVNWADREGHSHSKNVTVRLFR